MAQVTEVRLVDDLDGGAADESIAFALDQRHYELDLSEKHAAQLRETLAPFVAAARRAGSIPAARTRRADASRSPAPRQDTAAIREWATANGIDVSARGRIATSVREAYDNRTPTTDTAPPVDVPTTETPDVPTSTPQAPATETPAAAAETKPKRRARKKTTDAS